jgi:hypothetical protein
MTNILIVDGLYGLRETPWTVEDAAALWDWAKALAARANHASLSVGTVIGARRAVPRQYATQARRCALPLP